MGRKFVNTELMIGDEVIPVDVDKSYGTMNTPQLYKPYVVTGIAYRQRENWEGPDADRKYYTIEPLSGYSDEEATGRMLAGGGRRREERLYTNDDSWILRPGFRRGELNEHNQPGINPDLEVGDIIRVIDIDGEHANMPDRFGMYKVYSVMGLGGSQEPYYQLSGETSEVVEDSTRTTRMFKPRSTPTLTNAKYLYRGDTWIHGNIPMATDVDRKTISEQRETELNPELEVGDTIRIIDIDRERESDDITYNIPPEELRPEMLTLYTVVKKESAGHKSQWPFKYVVVREDKVEEYEKNLERVGLRGGATWERLLYPWIHQWIYATKPIAISEQSADSPGDHISDEDDDWDGGTGDGKPFTSMEVRILNTLHKYLTQDELLQLTQETPETYKGGNGAKFWNVMKLFGINFSNDVAHDTRASKYAKWAYDNWTEEGDYGNIENPIKVPLKWYDVDRSESGSQIEYKDGSTEVLGFDEDNASERADYDFYSWGGEMETTDWGDYEAYDSTVERVDFNRVDESITSKMGYIEIQDLLFNFWLKVGPTLDPDKLKLIGFDMHDNEDRRRVMINLVEYYGDEELKSIILERLEGVHDWTYEYVVTTIDIRSFDTYPIEVMVNVMINGDQEIPVSTEDGVIDMTLWETNEKAREEWETGSPGPYDNTYEEIRDDVLNDVSILLKNLPVEPLLDYLDFSEPGSWNLYTQEPPELVTEDDGDIDDMVYIDEPREKHIRRMGRELGDLRGFPLDKYKNMPPPRNESDTTEEEIEYLEEIPVDEALIESADKIKKHFTKFLTTKGLEYPKEELKEVMPGVLAIILILKYHYNRPRPWQIAQAKGLELNSETLQSSSSPSYPSGHATQGKFVARYLSDLYPEYRDELMQIGEDIAYSRNMAKVHYPSDSAFGKLLGNDMYDFITPNTINESAPRPGSSSAEGFDDKNLPYETEYLTLDEILSRVKKIAYYKEVLQDLQDDKDDWAVTQTVKRYADYWMKNPESLTGPDFPPIQVIGNGMKDGSHRISTLNALANHIDPDNPYWKNVKLEVRFYDPEIVMDSGHFYPWLYDIPEDRLQDAIDNKSVYNWEILKGWKEEQEALNEQTKRRLKKQIKDAMKGEEEVEATEEVIDIIKNTLTDSQYSNFNNLWEELDDKTTNWLGKDKPLKIVWGGVTQGFAAMYDMFSNTIHLPFKIKEDGELVVSRVIAELSHVKQMINDGKLKFFMKFLTKETIPDWVKRKFTPKQWEEHWEYDKEGNPEHEAHSVIEPELIKLVFGEEETLTLKEQVMMKKGDMLKADIFKFLSNRFALTPTHYSEIKDNEDNYYRLIDMEEPYEDVKLSHLLNPVVDFVNSGINAGAFEEEDIQKGLEAVTDWVSLAMNQKKDLMN